MEDEIKALRELINDKDTYNIITAIRGPDSCNYGLKWIFTARIRYLLGLRNLVVDIRLSPAVGKRLLYSALEELTDADLHYLYHVSNALKSLHCTGVLDEEEYEFLQQLCDIYVKYLCYFEYREHIEVELTQLIEEYPQFIVGR